MRRQNRGHLAARGLEDPLDVYGIVRPWIDDADPKDLRNLNSPEDLAGITGSK